MDIVLAIQHRFGHVSDDAVGAIGNGAWYPPRRNRGHGVVLCFPRPGSAGTQSDSPVQTPISLIKGAEEVARAFEEALDLLLGETSPDGQFTLEWTSDIGMADQEPSALINGMILTALDAARCPAGRRRSPATRREGRSISVPAACSAGGKAAESDGPDEPRAVWPSPLGAAQTWRRHQGCPHTAARKGDRGDHPIKAPGSWRSRLSHRDEVAPYAQRGPAPITTSSAMLMKVSLARSKIESCCRNSPILFRRHDDRRLRARLPEWASLPCGANTPTCWALSSAPWKIAAARGCSALTSAAKMASISTSDPGLARAPISAARNPSLLEIARGQTRGTARQAAVPDRAGLSRQPTAIDNVETLVCVARIRRKAAAWFAGFGTKESTGNEVDERLGRLPASRRLRGAVRHNNQRISRSGRRAGRGPMSR